MRYQFVQDEDCHWFLIEADRGEDFYALLDAMEDDPEIERIFFERFHWCMIDGVGAYTFTDPKRYDE